MLMRVAGAAGAILLACPISWAGPQDLPGLTETVDVNVVNVDVWVTDKKGQPVWGLEAADFKLFEDFFHIYSLRSFEGE